MPNLQTQYFDRLEYSEDAPFHFATGIPGFEAHRSFLFIQQPRTSPLVFMQSLHEPTVCFVVLPATVVDADYGVELSAEEVTALGLPEGAGSKGNTDLIPLVLVTFVENADPVVNLMSPIVLNLRARRGIQAIQIQSSYSLRHPLALESQAVTCS